MKLVFPLALAPIITVSGRKRISASTKLLKFLILMRSSIAFIDPTRSGSLRSPRRSLLLGLPPMDALLRAINEPETVRVVATVTTDSAREACRRQGATGVSAVVVARAITAGALLATLAKAERERVRVQLSGGGPIGQVMIDAHGDGRVRACVARTLPPAHLANRLLEPDRPDERPSVALAVGARGFAVVTRDLGLASPYQGNVEMQTGEIDEDLEHYLEHSEQLPSALRTAVEIDGAGTIVRAIGVLAQSFPGSEPELIERVRGRLAGRALDDLREPTLDDLVGLALGGESFRRMLEHPVRFHCSCGPARALSVLATLGPSDLDALATEQEQTEVRCNFCGQATTLDAAQVRELAAQLRRGQS
jgi:molecular chaperone Hsp33